MIILFVLLWGLVGFLTIWTLSYYDKQDVTVKDLIVSILVGPLLTFGVVLTVLYMVVEESNIVVIRRKK
jgi:hypothetical protein